VPDVFDVPAAALASQLLIGLINGSFYALMSLGVAVIFGILRIANFVHGAQYMMGAFVAWLLLNLPNLYPSLGLPAIGYWEALLIVPVVTAGAGMVMEKLFISKVYDLDHAYGILLTLGLSLVIEGLFRTKFGSIGQSYGVPESLRGGTDLGFIFLPHYRAWVITASVAVCFATWYAIERTKLGMVLRAATENPVLVQAFGIRVPRLLTLTYGLGVALAGLAGVMAAPIYQVSPQMGESILIVVFAVVVIGGMGSILGSIVSGFLLGVVEALTKVFWPEAASTVIFAIMAAVLLARPAGLFGRQMEIAHTSTDAAQNPAAAGPARSELAYVVGLAAIGLLAPLVVYPVVVMKVLCFALFGCALNLIFGYVGLLAFGHAAFFGASAYVTAHVASVWNLGPELSIVLGVAVATALGAAFGWLAIRRAGLYFAMITLALAQIVYFYSAKAPWMRGEDGIQPVPRGRLFGIVGLNDTTSLYLFVLVVFLAGFALVHRVIRSPFGQVLKCIRDNEPRAISLGYDADRFKLLAFTLSAAIAGLAGAMKTLVFQMATQTDLSVATSADVLLIVLIGGIGTVLGPVVGAAVLVGMQSALTEAGAWVLVIQGAIFVLCTLLLRRGVVGTLQQCLAVARGRNGWVARVLSPNAFRTPRLRGEP
jgi:branched-chain amino acid transport system permease protein